MKKIIDNRWTDWPVEVFVSNDVCKQSNLEDDCDKIYEFMAIDSCLKMAHLDKPHSFLKEFVDAFSRAYGKKGYGILNAHGDTIQKQWAYSDDEKFYRVQDWIDENDGRYAALILSVCNPHAKEIHSKKSLVIAPNNIISPITADLGGFFQNEIYFPGKGYVSSYVLEDELKQLYKIERKKQEKMNDLLERIKKRSQLAIL